MFTFVYDEIIPEIIVQESKKDKFTGGLCKFPNKFHYTLTVYKDNEPIAGLSGSRIPDKDGRYRTGSVYVREAYRGIGAAAAGILHHINTLGNPDMKAWIDDTNESSIRLHKKLGYVMVDKQENEGHFYIRRPKDRTRDLEEDLIATNLNFDVNELNTLLLNNYFTHPDGPNDLTKDDGFVGFNELVVARLAARLSSNSNISSLPTELNRLGWVYTNKGLSL